VVARAGRASHLVLRGNIDPPIDVPEHEDLDELPATRRTVEEIGAWMERRGPEVGRSVETRRDMSSTMSVDVWVRGTTVARTEVLKGVAADASRWTESDVRDLLTEMLLALQRVQNPDGEPPQVTLRGFSWIVSPHEGGVLVHLEMRMGTASAGPFNIDEPSLTTMIARVMSGPEGSAATVH
jgi:hypothetical protein